MAGALESFFEQQRKRGVQLTGAPKRELTKTIQQKGKAGRGAKITGVELQKAKKGFEGEDYLATVGRTYQAKQLSKDAREKFAKAGFAKDASGYYTKSGPITKNVLDKALGAGFDPQDVRSVLAGTFARNELDDQISKFLGEGGQYKIDPITGRWTKQTLAPESANIPAPGEVTGTQGIYGGINPDDVPGSTPQEIDYATLLDPVKIQAKSGERLGALQAGASAYLGRLGAESSQTLGRLNASSAQALGRLEAGSAQARSRLETGSAQALGRMQSALSQDLARGQTASAERLARLNAQAQKDITRSQQATDLLGKKMGYGTEYDISKMNRLAALQQANIQQATSLYNLIPSAF